MNKNIRSFLFYYFENPNLFCRIRLIFLKNPSLKEEEWVGGRGMNEGVFKFENPNAIKTTPCRPIITLPVVIFDRASRISDHVSQISVFGNIAHTKCHSPSLAYNTLPLRVII
jgi:hypothetical protein